jgi:hypothetical protein
MSNEDRRQYLTFTLREWFFVGVLALIMPMPLICEGQAQADWGSPLDAALTGVPPFGWYMGWALFACAYVTVLRLVIESLYGLMRPQPALSERRTLGGLAQSAAFWISVFVVSLVAFGLADEFGSDLVRT